MSVLPLVPVLLCGGSGTRLWPASRAGFPKQFVPLAGGRSLLQHTLTRLEGLDTAGWVAVTNERHRFLVERQAGEVGIDRLRVLLEPMGRNTAPAIAAAALDVTRDGGDALLLVLPADHVVARPEAFREAVERGRGAAEAGTLVTFGVVPARPETGYGYIRTGDALAEHTGVRRIAEFVEKPDADTAARYVESGDFLWNAGIFLFRASRLIEELETHRPEMATRLRRAWQAGTPVAASDALRLDEEAFGAIAGESIDYAVMEETDRGAVVPLDAGWDDAGSWDALLRLQEGDGHGNVVEGDVALEDVSNSYVRSSGRLVTCVGVDDLVVVETPDAVLVSGRDRSGSLKRVVDRLRADERPETDLHTTVHRPWGRYTVLDLDPAFQVKRIAVEPGGCLSLQYHHHRAEQWVVVRGTATVTRDDEVLTVQPGESVAIPLGAVHRLENRGTGLLEIIEVQTGTYFGEDDIVRLDDRYGRSETGAEG
ncbi:mannose-1-phosphate guanylyltransferase/mannose-6-phosphate isomerase [Gaopeijia maritima]|uniref:mannose-1-phosphate guanylyltransferase/mannose-6-phosphate isomerase n=1 Tax=Gaopeijia maritima TaxID=3119007 RepID=UPI0032447D1B